MNDVRFNDDRLPTDLKDFVDLSCNRDLQQTRSDLDYRVGPFDRIAIGDWRSATAYAHARLLPVLEETRLLTQRAAEIGSTSPIGPLTVSVSPWQEHLFKTILGVRYIDEVWLMNSNENELRSVLVEFVVIRWVRELINDRLRTAIQQRLGLRHNVDEVMRRMTVDARVATMYFPS